MAISDLNPLNRPVARSALGVIAVLVFGAGVLALLVLNRLLWALGVSTIALDLQSAPEGAVKLLQLVVELPWWGLALIAAFALGWFAYVFYRVTDTVRRMADEVRRQKELSVQFVEDVAEIRDARERLCSIEARISENFEDIVQSLQTSLENASILSAYARDVREVEEGIKNADVAVANLLRNGGSWAQACSSIEYVMPKISAAHQQFGDVIPQDVPENAWDAVVVGAEIESIQREKIQNYQTSKRIFQQTVWRARERARVASNRKMRRVGRDALDYKQP